MIDKESRAIIKKIKTRIARPIPRTESHWERVAVDYAKWIAARDRIELPCSLTARAIWAGVHSKTRKGYTGFPIFERRICRVDWCERLGWSGKEWKSHLTIKLPHWDWQPEVIDTSESANCLAMAA